MKTTILVVLACCCLVTLFVDYAHGAPKSKRQCAPDSPHKRPIKGEDNGNLPFCKQYQSLSCCDPTGARAIQRTVGELIDKKCSKCYRMVEEWKCSECHPEAGSFYVNERSSIKLCEDYCVAFFEACKDIPFDQGRGTASVFYLNDGFSTGAEWCKGKTAPKGKCFGGNVHQDVPNDTNCKCEDHKCHLPKGTSSAEQVREL